MPELVHRKMRNLTVSLVVLLAAVALSACVRTTMVRVPMTFAPRVPVRVFPSIFASGQI